MAVAAELHRDFLNFAPTGREAGRHGPSLREGIRVFFCTDIIHPRLGNVKPPRRKKAVDLDFSRGA